MLTSACEHAHNDNANIGILALLKVCPFNFFHLFTVGSQWQQARQRTPDAPLHSNLSHLLLGHAKEFPCNMRYVILVSESRVYPGVSLHFDMVENRHRTAPTTHLIRCLNQLNWCISEAAQRSTLCRERVPSLFLTIVDRNGVRLQLEIMTVDTIKTDKQGNHLTTDTRIKDKCRSKHNVSMSTISGRLLKRFKSQGFTKVIPIHPERKGMCVLDFMMI